MTVLAPCSELRRVVLDAGGRFYFAKDATLTRSAALRSFPKSEVAAFLGLKAETDPAGLLQSDLFRRLFGGADRATSLDASRA